MYICRTVPSVALKVQYCNALIVYVQDWYSSPGGPPHVYVGAFRLEHDLSWTPEMSVAIRTKKMSLVDSLFSDEDITLTKSLDLDYKASDIDMQ
jgi:hypothetical protein